LIFNVLRDSSGMLLQLLFSIVNGLIGFVLQVNHFSSGLISFLGGFSIGNHLFNLGVTETTT